MVWIVLILFVVILAYKCSADEKCEGVCKHCTPSTHKCNNVDYVQCNCCEQCTKECK